MDEIEVEAVTEIDPPTGVDAPSCVLYGGKGGVGKTTMAAATAIASARDGTDTLVISTDPAHSLADTFDVEIPPEPTQLDTDKPLWAAEIDPSTTLNAESGPLGIDSLMDDNNPLSSLFGDTALPGSDEIVALQQVMNYIDDDRFERFIVDTAPTGHTLRLLELPMVMDSLVGRIVTMRERMGGLLDGIPGMGEEDNAAGGLTALSDQLETLRSVLSDPTVTDFRIVLVPETMSIDESRRLLADLEEIGIPVKTLVVNRIMEDPSHVSMAIDAGDLVYPDHEGCEFCRRRWDVQREALTEAQPLFRGKEIKRVPLFASDVRGDTMLNLVASCLD